MLIGAIDCSFRVAQNIVQNKTRWQSVGISQSAVATVLDFGHSEQDVTVSVLVSEATKNTLASYLNDTIRPYGSVSVTPDPSDTLEGITGAGVAVTVLFISLTATWQAFNVWQMDILLRKYS